MDVFLSYLKCFAVGGLLCVVGQLLIDYTKLTPARILTLFVVILAARKGFLCPKEVWDFEPRENWDHAWLSKQEVKKDVDNGMSYVLAWTPYVLIALILDATRLNWFGLKTLLTSSAFKVSIKNILGSKRSTGLGTGAGARAFFPSSWSAYSPSSCTKCRCRR